MSVSREIKIRLITNKNRFSDLFIEFVKDFWFDNNDFTVSSFEKEDINDYKYIEFPDFKTLKPILDYREDKNYDNYLFFYVKKIDEAILIRSTKMKESYKGYSSHYELNFTPGIGKRIENAERYTDYSYYLNQILPRLVKIDCYICEIECHDFDS